MRAAIAKLPKESAAFYVHEDSTCSSLKHMLVENVVHDVERIDGISCFVTREVTRVAEVSNVPVLCLDQVIAETIPPNELIHFVKIDAQGVDIEVFERIGTALDRCLFAQIEMIVNETPAATVGSMRTSRAFGTTGPSWKRRAFVSSIAETSS